MVAKCANPSCKLPFRYLSEGRLFRLETAVGKYEYCWLCADCALTRSLKVEWGRGVVVVPSPNAKEPL
jgi:hypothetical protein